MTSFIIILMGFLLIGIGTCDYLNNHQITKTNTVHRYTVKDGKTGETLQESVSFDPTEKWTLTRKIVEE